MRHQPHVVVVPVKSPTIGKSRLRVPDHARPGLATAFALDVIDVVRQVPGIDEVVVMTEDATFAERCRAVGVRSVPDGTDLNDGLRRAAEDLRSHHPAALPVALCADLPSLSPEDLTAALEMVSGTGRWFCADAEGTGTTLYAAPYADFRPRFGVGSRAAHEADGALPVPGELATLRRDVDDEADLEVAIRLGAGPHTTAAMSALVP